MANHVGICILVITCAFVASHQTTTPTAIYSNIVEDVLVTIKPYYLCAVEINSTKIRLSWIQIRPKYENIDEYFIYYTTSNYTDVRTFKKPPMDFRIEYTLDGLKPNTTYKIIVKAFNSRNESQASELITCRTDITEPSAPRLLDNGKYSTVEYYQDDLVTNKTEFYEDLIQSTPEYSDFQTTPEFYENHSTVEYYQDDLVPDKPYYLRVVETNSNEIRLSWIQIRRENENIDGYFIYYTTSNYTNVRTFKKPPMEFRIGYTLDGLKPNTTYQIIVKAFNSRNESQASELITCRTDITEPSAPRLLDYGKYSTVEYDQDDLVTNKTEFYEDLIQSTPEYSDFQTTPEFYENHSTVEYYQDDLVPTETQSYEDLNEATRKFDGNYSTVEYDRVLHPSKPRNLSVLEVNSNKIRLMWIKPQRENEHINGYNVYYWTSKDLHYRIIKIPSNYEHTRIEYTLDGLKPNTEYRMFVKSINSLNESEPSAMVLKKTDISGPSAPRHLNVTCQARNRIYIQWERPQQFFDTIDYYYIYISLDKNNSYNNYTIPTSQKYIEVMYSVTNVTANRMYKVQVTGASYSNLTGRLLEGQVSEAKEVYVSSNCDTQQQFYGNYSTVESDQDDLNRSKTELYVKNSTVDYDQLCFYPSEPRNLSVLEVNSNEIRLSWIKPQRENGDIDGYYVYYKTFNSTDVRTFKVPSTRAYIEYTLNGLKPNTQYEISVKAFTFKAEGKPSKLVRTTAANRGPSAPRHLNAVCQAKNTIFIQWERPQHFFDTIDYYYINIFYLDGNITYQNYTIPTSQEYLKVSFSVANVTSNTYKVQVSGASYSQSSGRTLQQGQVIEEEVYVQPDCDKLQQYSMRHATVCSELLY